MRRPVAYVAVIVVVLLALGSPFLPVTWGGTDARALPATAAPRVVSQALARDFPANADHPDRGRWSVRRARVAGSRPGGPPWPPT